MSETQNNTEQLWYKSARWASPALAKCKRRSNETDVIKRFRDHTSDHNSDIWF